MNDFYEMQTRLLGQGFAATCHSCRTQDGWDLSIFRIQANYCTPTIPTAGKSVILWHGLSTSSNIFIASQEEDSLGTWLARRGFTVFLANSRGNKYTSNTQSCPSSSQYWDFSIDQHILDLNAVVDAVLDLQQIRTTSLIGFSQGATITLAGLSLHEDLNCKITNFIGLSPGMKPPKDSWNLLGVNVSETFTRTVFGSRSFLSLASTISDHAPAFLTRFIIHSVLSRIIGWRCDKFGPLHRQLHLFQNIFGLTSTKAFVHWFQMIEAERFQQFDGREGEDGWGSLRTRARIGPMAFPTRHITTRMSMFYGEKDSLIDCKYMQHHLPTARIVKVADYEHLDLIWAEDANTELWPDLLQELEHGLSADTVYGDVIQATLDGRLEEGRGDLLFTKSVQEFGALYAAESGWVGANGGVEGGEVASAAG